MPRALSCSATATASAPTPPHTYWTEPSDIDSTFHEPMVLFGFLAGITNLELVPGIITLPQRQTVLATVAEALEPR